MIGNYILPEAYVKIKVSEREPKLKDQYSQEIYTDIAIDNDFES